MRIQFVERQGSPERLVCEAELLFDDSPLAGMKLIGFSLWRGADGTIRVTLPARPYTVGDERRFFDLLRSDNGRPGETKRIKEWILEQYRAAAGE
jgi:hypothetical protein